LTVRAQSRRRRASFVEIAGDFDRGPWRRGATDEARRRCFARWDRRGEAPPARASVAVGSALLVLAGAKSIALERDDLARRHPRELAPRRRRECRCWCPPPSRGIAGGPRGHDR